MSHIIAVSLERRRWQDNNVLNIAGLRKSDKMSYLLIWTSKVTFALAFI